MKLRNRLRTSHVHGNCCHLLHKSDGIHFVVLYKFLSRGAPLGYLSAGMGKVLQFLLDRLPHQCYRRIQVVSRILLYVSAQDRLKERIEPTGRRTNNHPF